MRNKHQKMGLSKKTAIKNDGGAPSKTMEDPHQKRWRAPSKTMEVPPSKTMVFLRFPFQGVILTNEHSKQNNAINTQTTAHEIAQWQGQGISATETCEK